MNRPRRISLAKPALELSRLCAAALLAACNLSAGGDRVRRELSGVEIEPSLAKPAFVAPSTHGGSFDFRAATDGDVALVFFGYTNCPDICPVHMANISAALHKLPAAEASRVHVVFVTTDPARDTIERLRDWLRMIDGRIIGVRPDAQEAARIQSELGLQPAVTVQEGGGGSGRYEVAHAAQVIAFTPDDRARVMYGFGTRQADWAHDLPILLKARWKGR